MKVRKQYFFLPRHIFGRRNQSMAKIAALKYMSMISMRTNEVSLRAVAFRYL